MNHSVPLHLWRNMDDLKSGMRAAAFLAAIKRGALFIFQANTGKYTSAIVPRIIPFFIRRLKACSKFIIS